METFYEQFDRQLVPLTSKFSDLNITGGYEISPVVSDTWGKAEKKVLVVVETLDWTDIKDNCLLSQAIDPKRGFLLNPMHNIIPNLLQRAYDLSCTIKSGKLIEGKPNSYSVGIINYNAAKTKHLENSEASILMRKFNQRLITAIKRLKPTHIVCCGFNPFNSILRVCGEEVADWQYTTLGKVYNLNLEGEPISLVYTLDIEPLYNANTKKDITDDDDGASDKFAKADLLYLVCRNISNLFYGSNPYSISHVKPNPYVVDTIEKFDKVMEKLESCEYFSLDTEDRSLGAYNNELYIIQVAFNGKRGYIIPVNHPNTPFTEEEIHIVRSRFKKFLSTTEHGRKLIITLNGSFDLKVLRAQLGITVIPHRIWEITAGDHALDENVGLLSNSANKLLIGTEYKLCSFQGLRNICVSYDNDFYYTAVFSKEDRSNIGALPITDPGVLAYCAMDVQTIAEIYTKQLERADNTYVRLVQGKPKVPYTERFKLLVANQMDATVQSISYMEQFGSPLDVEYLESLAEKSSPLRVQISKAAKEFLATQEVKDANVRLNESKGRSTSGIFGGKIEVNAFSIRKKAHLELLFFDLLKLKPVNFTKTGERSIDAEFIRTYEWDHHLVKLYGEYVKAFKLFSTYVVGWRKKLAEGLDSRLDQALRASFLFFVIVTGRLASRSPNLQQIPSRGPNAKILKRAFTAYAGYLNINYDLSAHEIRTWAIQSHDEVLADTFIVGRKMREEYIVNPTPELKKKIETVGDSHVQSYQRFHGVLIDKNTPEGKSKRSGVKATIFGAIYSKGAKALGNDMKREKLGEIDGEMRKLKAERKELIKKLEMENA